MRRRVHECSKGAGRSGIRGIRARSIFGHRRCHRRRLGRRASAPTLARASGLWSRFPVPDLQS
ncbi:hypothetical protein FM103_17395 [Corynebacterium xerosis]|nr:hypothetical protein FM103_17395 [Corynebacterium xerosis]